MFNTKKIKVLEEQIATLEEEIKDLRQDVRHIIRYLDVRYEYNDTKLVKNTYEYK